MVTCGLLLWAFPVRADTQPIQAEPLQWWDHPLVITLPVAWEITKTAFSTAGTGTQSESFRETWTYEIGPGFHLALVSPRARVEVGAALMSQEKPSVPVVVVIAERDFERLMGLQLASAGEAAEDLEVEADLFLTLDLQSTLAHPQEFYIGPAGAEYYGIQFSLGL